MSAPTIAGTYQLTAEEKERALQRAEELREKLERQHTIHQDNVVAEVDDSEADPEPQGQS